MAENTAVAENVVLECCMAALCAEPHSLVGAIATQWWWNGARVEKGSRPSHGKGFSEDKFLILRDCGQGKRSTNLLDEQLLACCSDELADNMENIIGD